MTSHDQLIPDQARRARRVERRRDDQRGVILVWMALCLVAMLMFAAFMVDLGSWYHQSQDLQRTADAAALAGSTYLPNNPGNTGGPFTPAHATVAPPSGPGCSVNWLAEGGAVDATCAALKTIYKNGYPNSTVYVQVNTSNNRQLDISVQNSVQQYFSSFFTGPLSFTRSSNAQFSEPVNLGSPQNYYGMGTLLGYTGFSGGSTPNFWASISGYCESKEAGDEYATGFDGSTAMNNHNGTFTYSSGSGFPTNCDPTNDTRISTSPTLCNTGQNENCEFDPLGYSYVVTVPSGVNPVHIYVFNAGFDPCANQPEYTANSLNAAPNPPYGAPLMDYDSNLSSQYPCGGSQPSNATQFNTYYTLTGPNGLVAGSSNNPYTASTSWSTGYPRWTDLTCQIQNGGSSCGSAGLSAGTYYLNVSTLSLTYNTTTNTLQPQASFQDKGPSFGVHNYGIMVSTNSSKPKSTLTNGATYVCSGTCPTVFANTSTAEGATIVSPTSGSATSTATAYLADVPAEAVGKLVTLKIWDPGDFAQYIQIMKPAVAGVSDPLGADPGDPQITYTVSGGDPDAKTDWTNAGAQFPGPNNTAVVTSGVLPSTCTDPFSGSAPNGGGAAFSSNPTGPCLPVDGCTTDPLQTGYSGYSNPSLTACSNDLGDIGGANWGAPNRRFGPSRYSDSLVELSFIAPVSGWYGIAETTASSQVHDTITLNLLINGLPPHLTP